MNGQNSSLLETYPTEWDKFMLMMISMMWLCNKQEIDVVNKEKEDESDVRIFKRSHRSHFKRLAKESHLDIMWQCND